MKLTIAAALLSLPYLIGLAAPVATAEEVGSTTTPERLERFLTVAEQLRSRLRVPGVGIGIVVNHELVYAGGLGYRDVARKLPATEDTLFSICSNTKALTGCMVSRLVDKEILSWDQPIKTYFQDLKLSDQYVQKHVTLADACSHMTGLARRDQLWKQADVTKQDVIEQLQTLPFDFSLRKQFHYNNHMFALVGRVIEEVTNRSWEENLDIEIFDPLGMSNSFATDAEFTNHSRRTLGYQSDGMTPIAHIPLDAIGPAGSVSSTPADFSKWLLFWVNRGNDPTVKLLSEEALRAYERPRSASMVNAHEIKSYWAGWGLKIVNGQVEYRHSGGIEGKNAIIRARPSDGFGIFIFTNQVSEYKDLLADYADQIFTEAAFTRDTTRENQITALADTQLFTDKLMGPGGESTARAAIEPAQLRALEPYLNSLGYQLLSIRESSKALFVFKLNVEQHPNSANAWDSLAECFLEVGNKPEALAAYRKCLQLNPDQQNVKKKIAELQKQ